MATLNLGRIKPVFQGAYNNSTAYIVDDIVTFGDETFICIQASTGNATSNASYWTKLAAKGTDGTDVGATLTTQGDILYRDGSGLQRLAAGTSGQVLQTGGSGANPSWTNASSGKIGQVLQTVLQGDQSISPSANTWGGFSNIKIAITPTATSSKIFVQVNQNILTDIDTNLGNARIQLRRDSTSVITFGANIARTEAGSVSAVKFGNLTSFNYLDSPSTTSQVT